MHLALHNWMKVEPIEVAIRRLAAYGYRSLEISGEPYRYDTREVRLLLEENRIRCWGSVTLMLEDRNLLARDEEQRATSVRYVKDCITMVKELGGEVISVVPSTVGKLVPDATPDEEWRWAVDGMKEIYDHGLRSGVRIAIEPINRFETYFVNRGAQALALAEAVGPECGVCLDVFHMNIEEADMFATIREVGEPGRQLPRRRQQPDGAGDGPFRLAEDHRGGARDRLRRRDLAGVLPAAGPHPGEPLPRRGRPEPGREFRTRSASSSRTTGAA
jgi:D-psicose/D-tagatose/L-ribulose 3-epimerase